MTSLPHVTIHGIVIMIDISLSFFFLERARRCNDLFSLLRKVFPMDAGRTLSPLFSYIRLIKRSVHIQSKENSVSKIKPIRIVAGIFETTVPKMGTKQNKTGRGNVVCRLFLKAVVYQGDSDTVHPNLICTLILSYRSPPQSTEQCSQAGRLTFYNNTAASA